MHNVRHALRSIARMPAVTAVVVLSLAAGIGVNTVVFSWIQARVFKPIPGVSGASEFHLVEARTDTGMYPGVSWPEYRDLREGLRAFQALVAFRMAPLYVGEPGNVERAYGLLVSDNYFTALGLRPRLGRFPTPAEASPSGEPVAVISHDFWQTRFAADPNVTARRVRVNGRALPIAGVTPEGFQGTILGLTFDVWLPAALSPDGATRTRVVGQFVAESLSVVTVGALAGWVAAFLAARNVAGSRVADLVVFAGVPFLLLAVAAVACWLPARRAARLDPMVALRAD